MKNNSSLLTNYLYVTLSGILFGMLIFGGGIMKKYGFSLLEVIILPAIIVTVILFGFVRKDLKKFYSVPIWISVVYFTLNVIGHFSQYAPLYFGVSVSLTLFLLYTQPIWTIVLSTVFLKERFSKRDAFITFLIICGLVFLLAPWQELSYSVIGVIFGIIGGIEMAAWILFTSHFSKRDIKPLTSTFIINFYASIPFILAYPIIAKLFPDPAISSLSFDKPILVWFYLIIFAIIVGIGARFFFCEGAKRLNNIHLGLILLIEPVMGTLLDVSFLGTTFTWNMALGGTLILAANIVLIMKNARN